MYLIHEYNINRLHETSHQSTELPGEDVLLHLQPLAAAPETRQLVHVGVARHEVRDVGRHTARSPEHLVPSTTWIIRFWQGLSRAGTGRQHQPGAIRFENRLTKNQYIIIVT